MKIPLEGLLFSLGEQTRKKSREWIRASKQIHRCMKCEKSSRKLCEFPHIRRSGEEGEGKSGDFARNLKIKIDRMSESLFSPKD